MKLRIIRAISLLLGILIVGIPTMSTISGDALVRNPWFYAFEAVCAVLLYCFYRLNRCPHCKKQLGYDKLDKCPHCGKPLDV